MRGSVLVAFIAATPPTLAAALAFFAARASERTVGQEQTAIVTQAQDNLPIAVGRVESTVERIEVGVVELRERVERLEGAQHAHPIG